MTTLLDRDRFFGETMLRREARGVSLSETSHAGGSETPRHAHELPYLCLVLAGGFTERFGARSAACGPGTVVFHPAREEHADRFERSGARCFNVQLEPGMLAGLERLGLPVARVAVEGGPPAVATAKLRAAAGDRLAAHRAEAVVLELLGRATGGGRGERPERRAPPWLRRAEERLRTADAASPPRVAALAAEAGVHPVHLARTFRRHLGATPVEYLQRLRLERTTLMLARTSAHVARIAADAGFADHSHFCRGFKRAYGLSPSTYRELFR